MDDERDGDDGTRHLRDDGIEDATERGTGRERGTRVDRRTLLGGVGVTVAAATAGCFANESDGDGTTAAGGASTDTAEGGSSASAVPQSATPAPKL